ncbi:MAG: hypothetical protein VB032_09560 [Burkholderiaceae bacterium]|nr:hypothetical protein [Burkholderiaceae bacterium]
MNRKWTSILVGFAVVAAMLFGCTRAPEVDPETAALVEIVKKDEQYSDWLKIECVQFVTETQDERQVDIAMREKHSKDCLGDQDTSPVIDRFRIEKATGAILRYDVMEDKYLPVGQLHQQ